MSTHQNSAAILHEHDSVAYWNEENEDTSPLARIAYALENIAAEFVKRQNQEREAERKRCLEAVTAVRSLYQEGAPRPDGSTRDADSGRLARIACDLIYSEIKNDP